MHNTYLLTYLLTYKVTGSAIASPGDFINIMAKLRRMQNELRRVTVTFRDATSLAANLCSAMSVVNLPYLFTVMISLAVWSIFSC